MNLKVLKIIADQREKGKCLPHTDCILHRSLQNGVVFSGWKIEYILKWIWNLLKSSPFGGENHKKFTKVDTKAHTLM